MRRRLAGLLLVPLLASGSYAAQAPVPPVAIAPDARTQQLWEGLVDPCQGVRNALVRQGRDPSQVVDPDGMPVLETAWARTLPVLVEIAADPDIAVEAGALTALIDAQLRGLRRYASADEVIQFIEHGAELGRAAIARDSATEPGQLLLAIIWGDPDRREAWRYTARHGQLTGPARDAALRTWRQQTGSQGAELTRC
jgi:hypothetical protein